MIQYSTSHSVITGCPAGACHRAGHFGPDPLAGHDRSPQRPLVPSPVGRRLIGDAGVIGAIRQARYGLAAAEEKVGAAGVADGPTAGLLVEFQQRAALADRNDVIEQFRLRLLDLIGMGQRGIAADRRTADAQHRRRARLARPRRAGRRRLGAAGQAETMHLADHGVARDAAELGGDLARRQAVGPEFFEQFDPLVSPRHALFLPERAGRALKESPTEPGGAKIRPTHTYSPERFRRLSAARDVVRDNKNATIWRESGARVAMACVHTFLSVCG